MSLSSDRLLKLGRSEIFPISTGLPVFAMRIPPLKHNRAFGAPPRIKLRTLM